MEFVIGSILFEECEHGVVKEIKNIMSVSNFMTMRDTVVRMNTNVEAFIYQEMINHLEDYDPYTGLRKTEYVPKGSNIRYGRVPLQGSKGHVVGLEYVRQKDMFRRKKEQKAVLYIHGAAFQRRSNDLNLKTAERLCELTGYPVYVPDYRIGIAYHVRETLRDIVDSYRYLVEVCKYKPENLTLIADSSGCSSMMASIQKLEENGLQAPGKVVLLSPVVDCRMNNESIKTNWDKDIAFISNNLFEDSIAVFTKEGRRDAERVEMSPISGDYHCLKDSSVLIQVGQNERLLDDSIKLYEKLKDVCSCTLEIYEDMFHNFETYYSMCEMAKVSWDNYIDFMMA